MIRDYINADYKRLLGITYDEFVLLDFDEQQRILSEYRKNKVDTLDTTIVRRTGGDISTFERVPKGKRIITPNGIRIAGETYDDIKQRWEDKLEEAIYGKKQSKVKKLIKNNIMKRH